MNSLTALVYNADKGGFIDLSILDVLQIFGRAGRPQYEDHGVAHIITSLDKLAHYVSEITHQHPIESRFVSNLVDNLNAEVSIGTVTSVDEAVRWLSYTYLNVRMRKNPLNYGMDWKAIKEADGLVVKRRQLITSAAKILAKAQMITFHAETGFLSPKDLGRTGSNFYISNTTISMFNAVMIPRMTEVSNVD
jgi:replicative superfamily II helicase